jgi:hypothetical protein
MLLSEIQRFTETKRQLAVLWDSGIPTFSPSAAQWATWLSRHDEGTLLRAVLKTTAKFLKSQGQMDADYLVKYCSSVANSQSQERTEDTQ